VLEWVEGSVLTVDRPPQDDQRLIGEAAKNQAAQNPTNTVYDAKRLIGRNFEDATVQRFVEGNAPGWEC
jgi:molecular chaperone DnaK (HSP70)